MSRQIPVPFEKYRHFKGKEYQIICIAKHSETGESMVVYQALYGTYKIYTRPLAMFLGEVEKQKYPDVTQKYRFAKISEENETEEKAEGDVAVLEVVHQSEPEEMIEQVPVKVIPKEEIVEDADLEEQADPALLAFLDADTIEEKTNVLISIHHKITDRLIDSFAVTLDVVIPEGSIETRYQQLLRSLRMMQRYETERLR